MCVAEAATGATPSESERRYHDQLEFMLNGLSVEDLPHDTQIISTLGARPPCAERFRWTSCPSRAARHRALREVGPLCTSLSVILFLCDITDDEQFQGLLEIVYTMDGDQDTPPMICVQVLPAGQVCAASARTIIDRADAAVVLGLQDVITGCWRGKQLAHQITTSIMREEAIMRKLNGEIDARRLAIHHNNILRFHISSILWHDLPQRMRLAIPLADFSIEEDEGGSAEATLAAVAGVRLGEHLVRGCWGWVRQCARPHRWKPGDVAGPGSDNEGSLECIKTIVKNEVTTLSSLKAIHHMITCMKDLSGEDGGRHPNVLRLLGITSTRNHLYLHMEHADRCLHHRLLDSKKAVVAPQRLAGPALYSLAAQLAAAVDHLHARRICHRDIKPESFYFYDATGGTDAGGAALKLANFDLAIRQPEGVLIGTSCGTAPFAAPEVSVALQGRYDGLQADLWSTGITLLEVFCGIGVMEELTRGPVRNADRRRSNMEFLLEVHQFFLRRSAVYEVLEHLLPEVWPYRMLLLQLFEGLMKLEPRERRPARWLAEALPPGAGPTLAALLPGCGAAGGPPVAAALLEARATHSGGASCGARALEVDASAAAAPCGAAGGPAAFLGV